MESNLASFLVLRGISSMKKCKRLLKMYAALATAQSQRSPRSPCSVAFSAFRFALTIFNYRELSRPGSRKGLRILFAALQNRDEEGKELHLLLGQPQGVAPTQELGFRFRETFFWSLPLHFYRGRWIP